MPGNCLANQENVKKTRLGLVGFEKLASVYRLASDCILHPFRILKLLRSERLTFSALVGCGNVWRKVNFKGSFYRPNSFIQNHTTNNEFSVVARLA